MLQQLLVTHLNNNESQRSYCRSMHVYRLAVYIRSEISFDLSKGKYLYFSPYTFYYFERVLFKRSVCSLTDCLMKELLSQTTEAVLKGCFRLPVRGCDWWLALPFPQGLMYTLHTKQRPFLDDIE